MREVALLVTVVAVLYGLWMLMRFTFDMIDRAHASRRDPSLEMPGRSSRRERTD